MTEQRTILITGAARGIGKAIAQYYTDRGWKVIAPTRTELNLSSTEAVRDWLRNRAPLSADVLINNAGENQIGPIETLDAAVWEQSLRTNLTSPMLLSQAVAPHMRVKKWGRIVNISSIFAHLSRAGRAPYASSKTGLIGFTRTAAIEWGSDNVLVNAICPGYVETDLTRKNNTPEQIRQLAASLPIGRLAQPEEIARCAYFLGSDENTYITGQAIAVDGGFMIQ